MFAPPGSAGFCCTEKLVRLPTYSDALWTAVHYVDRSAVALACWWLGILNPFHISIFSQSMSLSIQRVRRKYNMIAIFSSEIYAVLMPMCHRFVLSLCLLILFQHRRTYYSVCLSARNGAEARGGGLWLLVWEWQHAVRAEPLPVREAEGVRGRFPGRLYCRGNRPDKGMVLHAAGSVHGSLWPSSVQKPHLPRSGSGGVSVHNLFVFSMWLFRI